MNNNGLILKQIKTNVKYPDLDFNSFDELEKSITGSFTDNGNIIAYLDYKVLIGKFENSKILFYNDKVFEPKFIKKIRVFNETKELHIWKEGNFFNSRLRIDEEGNIADIVEARQIIWGTEFHPLGNGFSLITEKRGTELIIPFESIEINDKKKRLSVLTRNYIDYNKNGQASYNDVRFVQFCLFNNENNSERL